MRCSVRVRCAVVQAPEMVNLLCLYFDLVIGSIHRRRNGRGGGGGGRVGVGTGGGGGGGQRGRSPPQPYSWGAKVSFRPKTFCNGTKLQF